MIAALVASLVASPPPAETARAFLDRLYTRYRDSAFSPLAEPDRVFAPVLAAAIEEDARLSTKEVGYLRGDPLCQCQDPAGLRISYYTLSEAGDGTFTAALRIFLPEYHPRELRLKLVRTAAGWRIADIDNIFEPSLLRALQRSNRERRR